MQVQLNFLNLTAVNQDLSGLYSVLFKTSLLGCKFDESLLAAAFIGDRLKFERLLRAPSPDVGTDAGP